MELSRLLIVPALMLVTGFRAPALADTYTLPAWEVYAGTWYYGDDVNDMYHYTGLTGLDWGRFNGVRWHQPGYGQPLNVTDDAGAPIPYTVEVALSADQRHLLLTIEPTGSGIRGDFNGDGTKDLADLFGFVDAWFAEAGSPQDLFTFLGDWSA